MDKKVIYTRAEIRKFDDKRSYAEIDIRVDLPDSWKVKQGDWIKVTLEPKGKEGGVWGI